MESTHLEVFVEHLVVEVHVVEELVGHHQHELVVVRVVGVQVEAARDAALVLVLPATDPGPVGVVTVGGLTAAGDRIPQQLLDEAPLLHEEVLQSLHLLLGVAVGHLRDLLTHLVGEKRLDFEERARLEHLAVEVGRLGGQRAKRISVSVSHLS